MEIPVGIQEDHQAKEGPIAALQFFFNGL